MNKLNHFIPQMEPLFGVEEKNALAEYMDQGGFLTEFKRTTYFERQIAEFTGSKHCIVVNNGTISLTLAALALGLKADDEVIVPNYTMIATPNSIKLIGCKPVFVDVDLKTLCLDFELVKKAITNKTKAIMLVAANGRYPQFDIEEFISYANSRDIFVIEDAAQSLGSYFKDGQHIGTKGAIGSFSFSAPKIISTGQGGALITNDDDLNHKIRKLKDFGRSGGGNDIHETVGFNFKFTELQACVGIEQFKKLGSRVKRKKEIYTKYKKNLEGCMGINLFENNISFTTPWFIDGLVKNRKDLIAFLHEHNIGSRVMYPPINAQNAYAFKGSFPISEQVGKDGLWLPSSVQITDEEIDHICNVIKDFYKRSI